MTAHNSGIWNSRLMRDRAAQHFGQVARANRDLAHQPVRPARPRGIPVAATLRQVFAGHHAQARGDHLHEDRHQAGQTNHPQQAVLVLRAALQVGAPVAGVHVTHADQNRRSRRMPATAPRSQPAHAVRSPYCAAPPATHGRNARRYRLRAAAVAAANCRGAAGNRSCRVPGTLPGARGQKAILIPTLIRVYQRRLTGVNNKQRSLGLADPDFVGRRTAQLNRLTVNGQRKGAIIVAGVDFNRGAGANAFMFEEFQ